MGQGYISMLGTKFGEVCNNVGKLGTGNRTSIEYLLSIGNNMTLMKREEIVFDRRWYASPDINREAKVVPDVSN